MAKKLAHGGKRKGAGRPPQEHKVVTIAVSVPDDIAASLETYREAKGWTRSKAVTEALRWLLKRK
jgi:metal-responsive CopG/Arc/MetJ family transcriptional regulator